MHGDVDDLFGAFCRDRDLDALAAVFERTAPVLLRRARRRLRDPEAAEDAVQELFLSLLQNGNHYDPARPCLPFLFGALERHAGRWRRRRAAGYAPLPDAPAADDPTRTAVMREHAARARRAIEALPAPLRLVVGDYLERELTPAEIAARCGQRPGTVRVQIHRGLCQLRRLLPGTPLLALGMLADPAPAAAAPAGVRALRPRWPWLAASALAIGAASLAAFPPAPAPAVLAADAAGLGSRAGDPRAGDAVAAGARDAVAAAARGGVELRVVDADGNPLAAVGAIAHRAGTDFDFALPLGASDTEGRIVATDLGPGDWVVTIDRGACATVSVRAAAITRHEIRAEPGVVLRGIVRDQNGTAAAGAGIWLCHEPRHPWDGQVVARADDAGRFELRSLQAMSVVGATAGGRAPSTLKAVGARSRAIELVLGGPGGEVRGTVIGPGGPVVDAVVRVGRHPRAGYSLAHGDQFAALHPGMTVRTDADGRFVARDLPSGPLEILARSPTGRGALATAIATPGMAAHVRLTMLPGDELRGVVTDDRGEPIAGAVVEAQGLAHRLWTAARTAADGTFRLGGVDPRRCELAIEADGFMRRQFTPANRSEPLAIALQPLPFLRGRLLANDGAPIAGDFELAWRPCGPSAPSPWPLALDTELRFGATAELDRAPEFVVRRRGERVWRRCAAAQQPEGPGDWLVRVPADLDSCARIRVRREGFTPAELADVALLATLGTDTYAISFADRGDPVLELPPLPPGSWDLFLFGDAGIGPPIRVPSVDLRRHDVEVTVVAPPRGLLVYELRCDDGTPVEQWRAFLVDEQGQQVPLRRPAGRVTVPAGTWRLWAGSLVLAGVRGHEVRLRDGESTELSLVLPRARPRQLAFWLPAGAAATASMARLYRDGAIVLGDEPDFDRPGHALGDTGFDCGTDGFCSIVMPLAPGRYRLELDTDAMDWSAAFDLAADEALDEPIVLSLAPRLADARR
jgi:RNA polymerase sigma-70 factor (ECF subfamily)